MLNFNVHLSELKLKIYYYFFSLCISFLASYFFAPNLICILSLPFLSFVPIQDSDFIFTNIFEVFSIYCTLALYSCCFFNIPLGIYLMVTFVKSGLFQYEKKILYLFLSSSIFLVIFSSFFAYYIMFPLLLSFLLNLDLITNTNFIFVKMETRVYDYIVFLCQSFFFYCFVIFQTPLLFFVFVYLKQPTSFYIVNKRKFFILFSLIAGCLFSSPDLLSLFVITTPFLVSFEIFVFLLILKYNYKNVSSFVLESCLNGKRQVC